MKLFVSSTLLGLLFSSSLSAQTVDPLAPTGKLSLETIGNAPAPPMGWNSWNAFGTDANEAKVLGFNDTPAKLSANVTGAKIIKLVARQIGSDTGPLIVAWGDALVR